MDFKHKGHRDDAVLYGPRGLLTVLQEVGDERFRQDERWGEQNHPDGTDSWFSHALVEARQTNEDNTQNDEHNWADILLEEVYEALVEADPVRIREELIQVAAVAINWAQAIDRRN